VSSGGYMAGQFQIAHSSIVKGVGIVAAGPFGCAESSSALAFPYWPTAVLQNARRALDACMATNGGGPDVGKLATRARELAADGDIDPLDGVRDDRAYLYSGAKDELVEVGVVKAAAALLTELGVPAQNVALWTERPGGHAFITEAEGGSCETTAAPYIVDCDYDQAGSILAQLLGRLEPKSAKPNAQFRAFAQRPFAKGLGNGFSDLGVVYAPQSCIDAPGCRVHVFFHGCEQGRAEIGDALIEGSGFAGWADANRLVILFPQVEGSAVNPKGCWDWWGYSGLDYLAKDAPQIAGVFAMLERLSER
jgi:poly(3-hydroxybutyrate) depolymerase